MNECGYFTGSVLLLLILLSDEDVWRFNTEVLPSLRAKVDVFYVYEIGINSKEEFKF